MHRLAPAPHVGIHVEDGQAVQVGDDELRVLHTPGHTPDSISLLAKDRVFTGDVLFIHGTGRADFAGGNAGIQYDSIARNLFTLPDQTFVFPRTIIEGGYAIDDWRREALESEAGRQVARRLHQLDEQPRPAAARRHPGGAAAEPI